MEDREALIKIGQEQMAYLLAAWTWPGSAGTPLPHFAVPTALTFTGLTN